MQHASGRCHECWNSLRRSSEPSSSAQARPKGRQGSSKGAQESGSIGGRPPDGPTTTQGGLKIAGR
eukprot:554293-Pyramimonas_sp.AAC.1